VLHGKGADHKRYLLMRDEKLGKLKLNTLVVKGMQFSRAGKAGINFSTQLMENPTDPETGKVRINTAVTLQIFSNNSNSSAART